MTAIYIIEHTDPSVDPITVTPNNADGPGFISETTNLTLYGAGSLAYGQEIDGNFLKLLENFSSPGVLAGSPATYVPAVGGSPPIAADANTNYFHPDKVQTGQAWYNTTTEQFMTYNGSVWSAVGSVVATANAPTGTNIGDLWYDTSVPQLKVLTSVDPDVWTSTADRYVLKGGDTMTGELILSGNPTNVLGSATKQYVDAADNLRLKLDGTDTMGAALDMGTQLINNVVDPVSAQDAATKAYVDSPGVLTAILQAIYPVGALYMSSSVGTSPSTILGFGTWVDVAGRVLIGEGDNTDGKYYTIGDEDGSKDAVTVSHTHAAVGDHAHSTVGGGTPSQTGAGGDNKPIKDQPGNTGQAGGHSHASAGVSGTDLNMPPYLAVYIWRRTA